MASKRVLTASEATVGGSSGSKRARALVLARLCDMALGEDLFANKLNALRAREKGILRSREATTKYAEVKKRRRGTTRKRLDTPTPPLRERRVPSDRGSLFLAAFPDHTMTDACLNTSFPRWSRALPIDSAIITFCSSHTQLEAKLYSLFHESGDLEFPEEEWVFDVLPELNDLEPETLDSLLSQAQTHAKYERAARELVLHERAKLEAEHASEMRSLRAELESERTRQSVSAEMRYKQLDNAAKNEREELWQEAQEKIAELEGIIDGLEEQLAGKEKELTEIAQEAESECDTLREEHLAAIERVKAAEEETDLKREASRKLKEEIIDNDKLTIANINRIKNLEALVDQHKTALDDVESENNELRAELVKSVPSSDAAEEADALREVLTEREAQLLAMSRRLSDVLEGDALSQRPTRRDSILDRFNMTGKSLMAPGV